MRQKEQLCRRPSSGDVLRRNQEAVPSPRHEVWDDVTPDLARSADLHFRPPVGVVTVADAHDLVAEIKGVDLVRHVDRCHPRDLHVSWLVDTCPNISHRAWWIYCNQKDIRVSILTRSGVISCISICTKTTLASSGRYTHIHAYVYTWRIQISNVIKS